MHCAPDLRPQFTSEPLSRNHSGKCKAWASSRPSGFRQRWISPAFLCHRLLPPPRARTEALRTYDICSAPPPSSSPRPKSVDPRRQLLGWFNDGVQKRPAFATAATPASGPTWPSRFRRVPFCPSPYGAIQPAACMGCAFCASARALKCTVLFMVSTMACNVVRLARVQCACTSQAT